MYDKTVEFLAKAATLIPTNCQDTALVKSHLITKCRDAEYDKQVTLSRGSFGPNILCKKCGNPWNDVEEIRIKKIYKFKHQKRLLQKCAAPGSKLESIQKKIRKHHLNKVMRICKFCKDVTTIESKKDVPSFPKTPKLNLPLTSIPKSAASPSTPQNKKAKKRKKDLFAGLNRSVVRQSMTPKVKKNTAPTQILSKTPKDSTKSNINKLAKALNSKSTAEASIMKLFK